MGSSSKNRSICIIMAEQTHMSREERYDSLDKILSFVIREIGKRVDAVIENPSAKRAHYLETDLEVYKQMKRLAQRFDFNTKPYDAQLEKIMRRLKK